MRNPIEGGDTHGRSPLCCCCWGRVRDVDRWFQSSNQVILLPLGSWFLDPSLKILTSGPQPKDPGQGVLICDSFPLFQDWSVFPALCFLNLSSRFWLLFPPKKNNPEPELLSSLPSPGHHLVAGGEDEPAQS